jgi:hypothetical protein
MTFQPTNKIFTLSSGSNELQLARSVDEKFFRKELDDEKSVLFSSGREDQDTHTQKQ